MKKILSESINDDIYTMEQWEKDKVLNIKNGQKVSNDVVRELMNCVPPAFRERGIFQPGEAYCTEKGTYYDLYMTFAKDGDDYWTYCGTCRLGETQPREMMDYGSINETNKMEKFIREAVENYNNPSMKVEFRSYTKKSGEPENGLYKILEYLNGLTKKDFFVRIDIDNKKDLGYDEEAFFCPSLKITNLKLTKKEDSTFEAEFNTKNLRAVFTLLTLIGAHANGGHSYELLIDNEHFYIDGDGADYVASINGVKLSKFMNDKYKWPDVYNKKQDENGVIKINESQLRKIIQESIKEIKKRLD